MRALRPTCPAPRMPRTRQSAALRSLFACAPPCLAHPEQTCIDAPKYILALELPEGLCACRGWSCCPWATLRGCCGCFVPTRWLETGFLCGRTVARIVSPEGWPASFLLAQAGGALGRLVCGGVAMDSPSGEGYVCGSGAGERRNHRHSACQTSTSCRSGSRASTALFGQSRAFLVGLFSSARPAAALGAG